MASVQNFESSRSVSVNPGQINDSCGISVYRCIACKGSTNLQFYEQTSTVVCFRPECIGQVEEKWQNETLPARRPSH